ncbi:MAG: 50S ribosomal protein L2 [Methermicoccaceae archaeon]
MGHRIISQNRGRGGPRYRAPSHRYKAKLVHRKVDGNDTLRGKVVAIEHDPARHAPVARVRFSDGDERYILVPEGIAVGQDISYGMSAEIKPGNTLPLSEIPDGVPVCNIEVKPGDGGKLVRASGVYATVIAHDMGKVAIKLPSGSNKWLSPKCMATIGVVAGGGRIEKPFVKAGKKYHKMKGTATRWPKVRGVAMNVIDHPFGGGSKQRPGRPKTVARGASAGRKVGSIAARRTGRR